MLETLVDYAWLALAGLIVLVVLGSVLFFVYDTVATYVRGGI